LSVVTCEVRAVSRVLEASVVPLFLLPPTVCAVTDSVAFVDTFGMAVDAGGAMNRMNASNVSPCTSVSGSGHSSTCPSLLPVQDAGPPLNVAVDES
jgi:hypothetical protein